MTIGWNGAGRDRGDRFPSPAVLLTCFGLLFLAAYLFMFPDGCLGNDFGVFRRAAYEPLTTVYLPRAINPFAYPPTTLLWLKLLLPRDPHEGLVVWTGLSIVAFAIAGARTSGICTALLALLSPALATTLALGQFGAILGAAILIAATLGGWRQGLLLGLVATVKPQLVAAVPIILICRGDWRAILAAALSALAVVALEMVLLGPDLWLDWLQALHTFPDALARADAYAGSVTPVGVAAYLHLASWPLMAMDVAFAILLIRQRATTTEPEALAALIVIASALLSSYFSAYDIAALMPFVVNRALAGPPETRAPALALFLCPFAGVAFLWLLLKLLATPPTGSSATALTKLPDLTAKGAGLAP